MKKSTVTLGLMTLLAGGLLSGAAWADSPIFARAAWQGAPPPRPVYTAYNNRWNNNRGGGCEGNRFERGGWDQRRLHQARERERFLQARAWQDRHQLERDREMERLQAERIRRDQRVAYRDRYNNFPPRRFGFFGF